jgi:hypothetical protein
MLFANNEIDNAISSGKIAVEMYPYDAAAYEFLEKVYFERMDYDTFYELYDVMNRRGIASVVVDEWSEQIAYVYRLEGNYDDVLLFSEGYCAVANDDIWGYVSDSGKNLAKSELTAAGMFVDGLVPVVSRDESKGTYLMDTNGDKKVALDGIGIANAFGTTADGKIPVFIDGTWSYYDTSGNLLLGGFEQASAYSTAGVAAIFQNDLWSLINTAGESISDVSYDGMVINEAGVVFARDRGFAIKKPFVIILDGAGNVVKETKYEDAWPFSAEGPAAVLESGFWGFIDENDNMVISSQYDGARSFANGMAAVKVLDKWGFIDESGDMVIQPTFTDVKDFSENGTVFVHDGSHWRLLKLFKYNHD